MYSTIYWITRLDALNTFFIVIISICCLALLFGLLCYPMIVDMIDEDRDVKRFHTWLKRAGIVAIIFGALAVFVPTKSEAILIYAGGKAYEYVESDTSLQKIPQRTTEYLKVLLEKEIKKTKKEASE